MNKEINPIQEAPKLPKLRRMEKKKLRVINRLIAEKSTALKPPNYSK